MITRLSPEECRAIVAAAAQRGLVKKAPVAPSPKCAYCARAIPASRKYCSEKCRNPAARNRVRPKVSKTCRVCGKVGRYVVCRIGCKAIEQTAKSKEKWRKSHPIPRVAMSLEEVGRRQRERQKVYGERKRAERNLKLER